MNSLLYGPKVGAVKRRCLTLGLFWWVCAFSMAGCKHGQRHGSQENDEVKVQELIPKSVDWTQLRHFVPDGFVFMDSANGDLNADGLADALLLSKPMGEEEGLSEALNRRHLQVLLSNAHGELRSAASTLNVVFCYDCGGVMGDPYVGMEIRNGSFEIYHYGGSAWRWSRDLTFSQIPNQNKWRLLMDRSESFHIMSPDEVETVESDTSQFGLVYFEHFSVYGE